MICTLLVIFVLLPGLFIKLFPCLSGAASILTQTVWLIFGVGPYFFRQWKIVVLSQTENYLQDLFWLEKKLAIWWEGELWMKETTVDSIRFLSLRYLKYSFHILVLAWLSLLLKYLPGTTFLFHKILLFIAKSDGKSKLHRYHLSVTEILSWHP